MPPAQWAVTLPRESEADTVSAPLDVWLEAVLRACGGAEGVFLLCGGAPAGRLQTISLTSRRLALLDKHVQLSFPPLCLGPLGAGPTFPISVLACGQSLAQLGLLVQPPDFACVTGSILVSGGGDVKIESQKLNFKEKAQAKVGSLDNVGHLPAGGAVKVVSGSAGGHGWGRVGRVMQQEFGSQVLGICHRPSVSSGILCHPHHCVLPVSFISPE